MNKKIPLEKMMQDYCKVGPPYEFTVNMEESYMKNRKNKIFAASACAALVLLCGTLFTIGSANKQEALPTEDTKVSADTVMESRDFFVKAFAEGEDAHSQELSTSAKRINKENPLIMKDNSDSSRALATDHIALEITGDNIESYDVKSDNGNLYFYVFRNKSTYLLTEKNVSPDGTLHDYFALGSELFDLPADAGEINRGTYLFWLPDIEKINDDAKSFEEKCELLQTAEDYNKYFGDTITVSVTYKDGRTETARIEITFDDDAYAYASISNVVEEVVMY